MRKLLVLTLSLLVISTLPAQTTVQPSPIKWYDIQAAMKLYKKSPRPILIDVYTDWCGWCKYMMKTTFANKNLASYINTYFYPVRFNAETKDTIFFQGKKYVSHGKTHDLALYLLDNRPAYPTLVFFDRHMKKYRIPGYQKIKDLEPLLVFFQEDVSNNVDMNTFILGYWLSQPTRYQEELSKVSPSQLPDTSGHVRWMSFPQAWNKARQQARPMLIFSYVPWCYSCSVMEKLVFSNPLVANFINENFYPIRFNAATEDTIIFAGREYVSLGKGQPNQLALVLFNKGFSFPAIIFLDNNGKNIGYVYGFYTPQQVMPMLNYFSTGAYKKQSFQQFLAEKHKTSTAKSP